MPRPCHFNHKPSPQTCPYCSLCVDPSNCGETARKAWGEELVGVTTSAPSKPIQVSFPHGLGDCCHFAFLLKLYQRRGFDIRVCTDRNTSWIWKAIGLNPTQNGLEAWHHAWSYTGHANPPLTEQDGHGSKVFDNLNSQPLPWIGPAEDLWDEMAGMDLEGVFDGLVNETHRANISQFLRDLPHPVILIHARGVSTPGNKDIPQDVLLELCRYLLRYTDGSIILLDWDGRTETIPNGRIRVASKEWGNLDLLHLVALYDQAALLIGVDSGPFHLGHFTRIPSLGVFHEHYPSCVSLPRATGKTAVMTRSSPLYKPVNKARRKRWNVLEYAGHMPTGSEVGAAALSMLSKPAYGLPIAADAMLRQWVGWMTGSTGLSSIADRSYTMDYLLRETSVRFSTPSIVETGCIRSPEDWTGAGNSTYLFAAYAHYRGGNFVSVDNSLTNVEFAKKEIACWGGEVICSDSVNWLEERKEPIDLLYLDSMDCEVYQHAEHGLKEVQAALPRLHDKSLVVYDDTVWYQGWIGKGKLGIPWLLSQGFKVLKSGYQVILSRS